MDRIRNLILRGGRKDARDEMDVLNKHATTQPTPRLRQVDTDRWAKAVVNEYKETLAALGKE